MPAIRFTALALIFALAGCSHVFKPTVTKQATVDDQGRTAVVYTNCDPTRVIQGENECYSETYSEMYCYRTLSDVECYPKPIASREPSITEAKKE
ncbi:MAG: hypothetical protein J4G10_07325 [Alphaproteobacteria bacterium]|nr:hypothetical protein [Alphaproteobacteria bacterium]